MRLQVGQATWIALTMTLALTLGCRPHGANPLLLLAPRLAPAVAEHLLRDDPEAFGRFAKKLGASGLKEARIDLMAGPPLEASVFIKVEAALAPHLDRVLISLARDFGIAYYGRALEAYRSRSLSERMTAVSIIQRHLTIVETPSSDLATRALLFETIIAEAKPLGDVLNVGDHYSEYSELLPRLNRGEELADCLKHGADYSLAFGDTNLACQFLGVLGVHHALAGDDVGMSVHYDRALELARASQSWHEARILSLYSSHYKSSGNMGRATALMAEAERRSRELGADAVEIRFLCEVLRMQADMSCWDLVERGLVRADILIRRGEGVWKQHERSVYATRTLVLRMRLLAARGSTREATQIARRIPTTVASWPNSPNRESAIFEAVRVMAKLGQPAEARVWLTASIERCENQGMPEALPRGLMKLSEIDLKLNDTTACQNSMALILELVSRDSTNLRTFAPFDLLQARVLERTSGRQAATDALADGLDFVQRNRSVIASSPETQLLYGFLEDYRAYFHELHADRPALGYAFEMAWPELFRMMGTSGVGNDPASIVRSAANGSMVRLPSMPADVVHCLYRWDQDQVVRWTRSGASISRDILDVRPPELEKRLDRVRAELSSPVGSSKELRGGTVRELRVLARLLLPGELLDPADHRRLLVTRNGPLAGMPFEVLNMAADGYEPLLARRDIAYANTFESERSNRPIQTVFHELQPTGGTLVVTSPRYDPAMQRRWSILGEPLVHGVGEALRVAAGTPSTTVLQDSMATHDRILERWEQVKRIYLVAHFVADPDLSYLTLFPLALGADGKDRIDMNDLRRADLSRCELAVLSGCATGVRYRSGSTELPSFGDLFLEAGARNVIVTGWNVDDANGALLMHQFNDHYGANQDDPTATLCVIRRDLIRRGAHPHVWAAYTILSNVPVRDIPGFESESAWNLPR